MAGMICEFVAPAATPINYCTLGLWGKPVIWYPIRPALDSGVFDCVLVSSEDPSVRFLVEKYYFSAEAGLGRCTTVRKRDRAKLAAAGHFALDGRKAFCA